MTCTPLPGGGFACSRGSRKAVCDVCKKNNATKLCDFPLKGSAAGRTCDRKLCASCTFNLGKVDYCPAHIPSKAP